MKKNYTTISEKKSRRLGGQKGATKHAKYMH